MVIEKIVSAVAHCVAYRLLKGVRISGAYFFILLARRDDNIDKYCPPLPETATCSRNTIARLCDKRLPIILNPALTKRSRCLLRPECNSIPSLSRRMSKSAPKLALRAHVALAEAP